MSINGDADETLMLCYRDGDAEAFARLYARHKGPLYRYLLRQCGPSAIAEELFQDVWLKLIAARAGYTVQAKFTTWLYRRRITGWLIITASPAAACPCPMPTIARNGTTFLHPNDPRPRIYLRDPLTDWAKAALTPGSLVLADGLACFTGVIAAGCSHQALIIGLRKPNQVPEFRWVNTLLGNLKTSFSGAYHAFDFAKYGTRYLAAFAYRFNRRFHLDTLPARLLVAAAAIGPRPARWLRQAEESCESGSALTPS